jgi:polyisoprenoid-binding protein YceI
VFCAQTKEKQIMRLTILVIAVLLSRSSLAASYLVDQSHSDVGFKIKHLFSVVSGQFKTFEGQFEFDEKNPTKSSVTFNVTADSIDTNEKKRDNHLRSPDFFDVKKFPKLTFKSTKVEKTSDKTGKLEGDLTIHGVTKPVTFDVEYLGLGPDPWKNVRTGFSAQTKINRKDFGLTWNKVLEAGGLLVGDEVEIEIHVEGIQKK